MEEIYKNFSDLTRDIIELRREVFIEEQHVPMELELEANENQFIHCCIYLENKLIAYARVSKAQPFIIGRVCIKQGYRNQGFGRKIMQYAENQIPMHQVDICIHAQTKAKGFYEALDYISYGQTYVEANIEHVMMKKRKV